MCVGDLSIVWFYVGCWVYGYVYGYYYMEGLFTEEGGIISGGVGGFFYVWFRVFCYGLERIRIGLG